MKHIFRTQNNKYLKHPTIINRTQLQKSRYTYRTLLNQTKTDYIKNKINHSQHDYKKLFNITKTLLGKKNKISLPTTNLDKTLCTRFGDFFSEKVEKLCYNLDLQRQLLPTDTTILTTTCKHTFTEFERPTITDIYNLIVTAKTTSPSDPIPLKMTKILASTLAPIYKQIIDTSLMTGEIPNNLKYAIINPYLKKPDLDVEVLSNYRPVSQLPLLSKILEKIVNKQIISYLNTYDLLDRRQNAFRKNHSTETTLLSLFDDLYKSLDSNLPIQLILLDLSAAFDTIDFDILIERLRSIGIGKVPIKWFSNFIRGRSFSIKINETLSQPYAIKYGVPQGSTLSPILFSIYLLPLNKLLTNFPHVNYNLYADDIELHAQFIHSINLQSCLTSLQIWLTKNNLLLNPTKTELINFITNSTINTTVPLININNINIIPTENTKYLGFHFTNKLDFTKHISKMKQTSSYHIYNLKKLRPYLTKHTAIILSNSLIMSRFLYCNSLLAGENKTVTKNIDRLVNRTTRIIFNLKNTDYTTSITNLRKSLNWLPTIDNINIKLLTILYKTTKTTQPHNLHTLLHKQTTNRQLRQTYRLDIPTTRLRKYGNKRFSWRGATLWNKLPQSIRKEDISITTFKYKLKELFKRSPLKYHISNPI